jgi:hypothetical protein
MMNAAVEILNHIAQTAGEDVAASITEAVLIASKERALAAKGRVIRAEMNTRLCRAEMAAERCRGMSRFAVAITQLAELGAWRGETKRRLEHIAQLGGGLRAEAPDWRPEFTVPEDG